MTREEIERMKSDVTSALYSIDDDLEKLYERFNKIIEADNDLSAEEFEQMVNAGFTIGSKWKVGEHVYKITAYYPRGCKFSDETQPEAENGKHYYPLMEAHRLLTGLERNMIVKVEQN